MQAEHVQHSLAKEERRMTCELSASRVETAEVEYVTTLLLDHAIVRPRYC